MVYPTDQSKAVVPVLVLLFVALLFILRGDLFYVLPCVILFLCFFSPFSIAITSLGKERATPIDFRTFVRFVHVWICRFPLPLGVWEGLRFVIVALPGLFSYPFYLVLFCSCVFCPFRIVITSLDEERTSFGAFRTFVRFALVFFFFFFFFFFSFSS